MHVKITVHYDTSHILQLKRVLFVVNLSSYDTGNSFWLIQGQYLSERTTNHSETRLFTFLSNTLIVQTSFRFLNRRRGLYGLCSLLFFSEISVTDDTRLAWMVDYPSIHRASQPTSQPAISILFTSVL